MHRLARLTSTARSLDLRLPTHRFWLVAAGTGGLVTLAIDLARDLPVRQVLLNGAKAGLVVFLAWAIAREIDPDEARTANLAAVLAIGVIGWLRPGDILPAVLILLAARLTLRSTGYPPTVFDYFPILPAWVFFAAASVAGWMAGLTLAFAVARDHRLPDPAPPRSLVAAFLTSGVAAGAVLAADAFAAGWTTPGARELTVTLAGIAAGLSLRGYVPVSTADLTGEPLDAFRLRSARRIVLVGASLAALVGGAAGMAAMGPVWAALAATALIAYRLVPAFGPR